MLLFFFYCNSTAIFYENTIESKLFNTPLEICNIFALNLQGNYELTHLEHANKYVKAIN